MANQRPLTDEEGEVRELTREDFTRAVPFSALPAELQALLADTKQIVPDVENEKKRKPAA